MVATYQLSPALFKLRLLILILFSMFYFGIIVHTSPTITGKCIDGNLLFELKIKVFFAISFQFQINKISWISNINLQYIPDKPIIQQCNNLKNHKIMAKMVQMLLDSIEFSAFKKRWE